MDDAIHLEKFNHDCSRDLEVNIAELKHICSQNLDFFLVLDLEGRVEILEFPVLMINSKTMDVMDFFHRLIDIVSPCFAFSINLGSFEKERKTLFYLLSLSLFFLFSGYRKEVLACLSGNYEGHESKFLVSNILILEMYLYFFSWSDRKFPGKTDISFLSFEYLNLRNVLIFIFLVR